MQLLGIDLGTSAVKISVIDRDSGKALAYLAYPEEEMEILAPQTGWAEQSPEKWWKYTVYAIHKILNQPTVKAEEIKGIGISYQMHGLVVVDQSHQVLRPSIIWCDSRAVDIGRKAFDELGSEKVLPHLLNSPGNFTASKLKWVKDNEPDTFDQIHKIMLPGDFISMKLTGEISTSISGLSEGIFWDFLHNTPAQLLLDHYGFDASLLPSAQPSFSVFGELSSSAAEELGLKQGTPVAYKAGDQPNNAFSLGAVNAGEIAATAGTSGVVYGVTNEIAYDSLSRVNSFAHVNHTRDFTSLGILLCVNGTGILNSWLKRNLSDMTYEEMNQLALEIVPGADGLTILPFGNGAERVLMNQDVGAQVSNINFNIHTDAHLIRAAHEGIAYSFRYGIDIMKDMGLEINVIRAGYGNMFLSQIFGEALSTVAQVEIDLLDTNGSEGAARGAGVGIGAYKDISEAIDGLDKIDTIMPRTDLSDIYSEGYDRWKEVLQKTANLLASD